MISIDLSGKTALVTGATGELGRVMARTLAAAGADVAVHYHSNQSKADELVAECQAMGVRAVAVQADVASKESIESMREATTAALGAPQIIVNNAVIQYEWTSVLEQAEADYESQFRSSVLQNVLMAQAFVPAMIERGWGRVIGINTECTMQCWPNQSAYISGKAGMDRVLRVLAKEVGGHGITVNQIAPGWMLSENRTAEGTPQWYLDGVALKRRGKDQEIANAVVFLASDLASFISGVYLPVCGGNVMPGI
jgi:3-oxoacyl-[acyl-carrier protein] reductase